MTFKLKDIIPQLITVMAVVLVFGFFANNASVNMENRGIDFGFGFLSQAASFDVQFSLIDYDGSHSYFRAYLVGLLNTLLVSIIGIILATILGVIIGVARLSPNYLINKFAAFYVEFFRNIPLLLQIFFWYFAALRALPLPQNAEPMFGNMYMTIKGLYVPTFIWENFNIFFYSVIAAIISIIVIKIHAKKVQETQGKQIPVFMISIGLIIILPLLSFLIGGVSATLETPKLIQLAQTSFKFEGGINLPPELIALTLALALYTATFIAECVRAGIQGVGKGQKEAAASIGLTPNQVLKLVVMPQALRIIIPPTTNQYLNLTKNSSLAAAIAYPDLVLVFAGTALMQTGKAIEIVFMTMFTYLTLSISISLFMNWYNKKIAIQEK
ncbi:amino acid ABC transporter membrane protein 1, PAAT family [Candidatus Pelagibacter sp. HIMB1321]|uniref:amino acid ABC transporter permease n=2 Tax=Candidatus Pelagibacter sp. HIMB1321 TaxID=1388755 RepID=UPI000A0816D0|nr:ABC transporter permease subunit [Candidatus Pelagibacter sp. HIMB1321]SMF75013.1 amino acid ABC transporter membrane protein 1, PAAT family [Candidatus Pelagibacter sp. HIMB1321]